MDTADDIAYAIHDLEDFHRVGVLQQAGVAAELTGWRANDAGRVRAGLPTWSGCGGGCATRTAGSATTTRSRRPWPACATSWSTACSRCRSTARSRRSRRSRSSPRGGRRASSAGVKVGADPPVRSAHVALATAQWHEVAVLKFVHQRFVLRRPDLASHQRGQATVLAALVEALTAWLAEDGDGPRLPPRLHDLVELARAELGATAPARGRAVVDYVASLTDGQAAALLDVLTGRSGRLWTDAPSSDAGPLATRRARSRLTVWNRTRRPEMGLASSRRVSRGCRWPASRRPPARSRR